MEIVEDVLAPGEGWYDVEVLRSLIVRAQRGDKTQIVVGPVLQIDSEIVRTVIQGDEVSLNILRHWLTPLTDVGVLSAQEVGEGGEKRGLEISGPRTTVESFRGLVKGSRAEEILVSP